MNRGEFQFIDRAKQLVNFKGLNIGKITPTDIDGVIEYKNKAYVFVEVKYKDKELPFGQRLALERLIKDTSINKQSIAIVCEHSVDDAEQQIEMANCKVRELYLSSENKWRPPTNDITVKQMIDLFIEVIVEGVF